MTWINESERHSLASRGIKTTTKYTRTYRGMLVKDYGLNELLRKLQNRYPDLIFYTDAPLIAPKSKELYPRHELTVMPSVKFSRVLRDYDGTSFILIGGRGEWTALRNDDEVDLYKELDKLYDEYEEELK